MDSKVWAFPTEYSTAASAWLNDAVDVLSRELHPLLKPIKRERVSDLPRPEQHDPESAHLASPLFRGIEVSHVASLSVQDVVDGHVGPFLALTFVLADEFGGQMIAGMFGHLSDICDANGQTISAEGRDFFEAMIEMLESIEISFDENGKPDLTMVMHPDMAEKLRNKKPTAEQEARIEAIYERRREEWNAARRRQDLP